MEIFGSVLSAIFSLLTYPMNIYGFTVSFWSVVVFVLAAGVIFGLIGRLLNGD